MMSSLAFRHVHENDVFILPTRSQCTHTHTHTHTHLRTTYSRLYSKKSYFFSLSWVAHVFIRMYRLCHTYPRGHINSKYSYISSTWHDTTVPLWNVIEAARAIWSLIWIVVPYVDQICSSLLELARRRLPNLHYRAGSSGVMRERKQRGSETKTYILTKAVGMAYGDNGPLFTKLLGGA